MKDIYNSRGIRLIKGDSFNILPTLADSSIDFILSDPPFGHDNQDGDLQHQLEKAIPARRNKRDYDRISEDRREERKDVNYIARPIANDSPDLANKLVKFIITQAKRLLVKGGNIALCCSGGGGPGNIEYATWSLWLDEALSFKQIIPWDKGPMGLGWHYRRSYEFILVATKEGAACKWYRHTEDEKGKKHRESIENIIRSGMHNIRKIIPAADQHPNEKPIELAEFFIKNHTQKGDIVLDPCAGRGWVAEACARMGRRFIGVEIDPHWAKRMKRRIAVNSIFNKGFGVEVNQESNYDPEETEVS